MFSFSWFSLSINLIWILVTEQYNQWKDLKRGCSQVRGGGYPGGHTER
jgi:hypothetical protein